MEKHTTPKAVLEEARELIIMYGEKIIHMGDRDGLSAYRFLFPENSITGFPYVFLYSKEHDSAKTITGFDALDVIGDFTESDK